MRGLIIDDDQNVAEVLRDELRDANISLDIENNGSRGLERALQGGYDFLLLDIVLPELSGVEICKEIRKVNQDVPILMLTSKDGDALKVSLLELGADDYITKPFSLAEVIARVKAILRRARRNAEPTQETAPTYRVQDLVVDTGLWKVTRAGTEISLTPYEFDLLICLAESAGRPISRERLIEHIQGAYVPGYDHSLNTSINRLRSKLETDAAEPRYIKTVRGIGYMLATE